VDRRLEAVGRGELKGKALTGGFKGTFSVRVGDWRALYRQAGPDLLEIVTVQHRREVYRNR
jgi:mRNA-degrading endonuclease RelE of RelBE toxin-antitoxin system